MGMYTLFQFNCELKQDTPKEVLGILRFMLGDLEQEPQLPEHALFKADRWRFMLRCDSYYFDAKTSSKLIWDDIANSHYLNIQCSFKNYDNEVIKFLDWINPYIDANEKQFLGLHQYKEDEQPTLIYYKEPNSLLNTGNEPLPRTERNQN